MRSVETGLGAIRSGLHGWAPGEPHSAADAVAANALSHVPAAIRSVALLKCMFRSIGVTALRQRHEYHILQRVIAGTQAAPP
jgi:hypothetical protein